MILNKIIPIENELDFTFHFKFILLIFYIIYLLIIIKYHVIKYFYYLIIKALKILINVLILYELLNINSISEYIE